MTYAQTVQVSCSLVGQLFHLGKREAVFGTLVVGPQQGCGIRPFCRPAVHHIVCEVKLIGHYEFQML